MSNKEWDKVSYQQSVDANRKKVEGEVVGMDSDGNEVKCRICKCGKLMIYRDDPVCSKCGDDGVTECHGLGR